MNQFDSRLVCAGMPGSQDAGQCRSQVVMGDIASPDAKRALIAEAFRKGWIEIYDPNVHRTVLICPSCAREWFLGKEK